jgi:hypothetical protein
VADSAVIAVIVAAAIGLALSLGIEGLMDPRPQPFWRRPWSSNALHAGLWLTAYGLLVLLLGRPWFALASVSALFLVLVLVNNAKVHALREPFVFQDYEYFTDAIRHPRLYIPFLGWSKALLAGLAVIAAVATGLWLEAVPTDRLDPLGQLGALLELLALALTLIVIADQGRPEIRFEPDRDLASCGFLAFLWWYAVAEGERPSLAAPFDFLPHPRGAGRKPHLVVIQSESFFDPRGLYPGIRQEILAELDALKATAALHGKLEVPAWGANTVRTEFAFLSAIPTAKLGVHRFNPYRRIGPRGVRTLASYLKSAGYRTVCVHPYPASFNARDRVYPKLGFDELIDIGAFEDSARSGPFIGDAAVAEKIETILDQAAEPVFVFAITMENHGPLHLEKVGGQDVAELYSEPPPAGCEDLTVYLRHLRNANGMAAALRRALSASSTPAWLCWFGDHVPIMANVYRQIGYPDGKTDFFMWRNGPAVVPEERTLHAHDLAVELTLAMQGLHPSIPAPAIDRDEPAVATADVEGIPAGDDEEAAGERAAA